MENNEKQHFILVKTLNPNNLSQKQVVQVPVTKEAFDDYYRPINAHRKKMQNHGRCVCPESKRLLCNMDCCDCPYIAVGDVSSLNDTFTDEDNNEVEFIDELESTEPNVEEEAETSELIKEIHKQLEKLTPEYREICNLIMLGKTEREIAEELHMPKTTVHRNKENAFALLKKEIEKFL